MKHLYVAFWNADVFKQLHTKGSPGVSICDFVGSLDYMTCDTRDVDCPACRETFLQALPTGDGSKLTWDAYQRREAERPRVTLAQRAAADAGWSTGPVPKPVPVWATTPPADAGWSTVKPPAPNDGWTTKR